MSGKRTILIVDDEAKIAELLKSYLEAAGYCALCAANGAEGLTLFGNHDGSPGTGRAISLILLDLMLPDFSGEDFCRKIRQVSSVPIIMVTAKIDEESIIRGLNIGADDYVCKPFSPRQLTARVGAVIRRSGTAAKTGEACLSYGGLTLDTENRAVSLNGEKIAVTRDEYKILALLMSRKAKIFTRDEILDAVKGDDYCGFDRSIDSHIKRLRAKLNDAPGSPKYITTVYGIGYRFGET
ncbi:MAG: response regulator transcription factor [Spirochaetaceae bacterium]|jgi:DNA-binding response OmpR family regulator|nr:response regulator transcription factor [Spirochaetaceae bacterium]